MVVEWGGGRDRSEGQEWRSWKLKHRQEITKSLMCRIRFGTAEGNSHKGSTVNHNEEARGFVGRTGEDGSTMWRIL